jgi:hypothetical protein
MGHRPRGYYRVRGRSLDHHLRKRVYRVAQNELSEGGRDHISILFVNSPMARQPFSQATSAFYSLQACTYEYFYLWRGVIVFSV